MVVTYFFYEHPKGQWHWYVMKHGPGDATEKGGARKIAQSVSPYATEAQCKEDIYLIQTSATIGQIVHHELA